MREDGAEGGRRDAVDDAAEQGRRWKRKEGARSSSRCGYGCGSLLAQARDSFRGVARCAETFRALSLCARVCGRRRGCSRILFAYYVSAHALRPVLGGDFGDNYAPATPNRRDSILANAPPKFSFSFRIGKLDWP